MSPSQPRLAQLTSRASPSLPRKLLPHRPFCRGIEGQCESGEKPARLPATGGAPETGIFVTLVFPNADFPLWLYCLGVALNVGPSAQTRVGQSCVSAEKIFDNLVAGA